MMWWHGFAQCWGLGAMMGVFWLLILALIVGIVVWLAWGPRAFQASGGPPGESPEDILKRRYARGEIDDEEYHWRLDELRR